MDIMAYMFDEENNKRLFGLEQWRLGEEKGREEGRNEGRVEGRVEGREEGQKLTAINLLNMNMDISFIEKATTTNVSQVCRHRQHGALFPESSYPDDIFEIQHVIFPNDRR